jgi:signal transduction histidine kinase
MIILLAGVNQVLPGLTGITTPLSQLLTLLSMLSYYLSFAPPRWLRQAWQLAELQNFLRAMAGRPASERVSTALNQLCLAGTRAVGGLAAAVALWDVANQRLTLHVSSGHPGLIGSLTPSDGTIGRAWHDRQPMVARTPADFGSDMAPLASAVGAGALLVVPIATAERAWGLLVVFFNRPPLFATDDLNLLALLTEQSAIALDYAALLEEQQTLVTQLRQQTVQLEATNHELEAFSYSVAHDLRSPLRGIDGFSQALIEDYAEALDATGQGYLRRICAAAQRMGELIDGLLTLSRITRGEFHHDTVDLTALAETIAAELQQQHPERKSTWRIAAGLIAYGDTRLLRALLENLLGNAWKFTAPRSHAHIEIGVLPQDGHPVYFVRDDGVGFDMTYADKLFGVFQRLHAMTEFEGTGIGLATAQRIAHRHGGRVWAEGAVDQGATVSFTLG